MKPPIRILLVEDDATSRAVLAAALGSLPADVDAAPDIRTAMAHAASRRFDLWLLDAHLPDGSGVELLARLRALDGDAIAMAHTASCDAALARSLRAAGFVDVVVKPLPAERLRDRVRSALGDSSHVAVGGRPMPSHVSPQIPEHPTVPLLDDDAAAAAVGDPSHVAALRALFATELAGFRAPAFVDTGRLHEELHRLRASCGFVGAVRLGHAAAQLHRRTDAATHAEFLRVLEDTDLALAAASARTPA